MKKQYINTYSFCYEDKLFFDTNIWMYIYGPLIDKNATRLNVVYAKALKIIREKISSLFIDNVVLSEFINAYAKLEFNQSFHAHYASFKAFRQSKDFKSISQDIADNTKKIIQQCKQCNLSLNKFEIMEVLEEYSGGKVDFNDQLITKLCILNQFILVTHDVDFSSQKYSDQLVLLTANNKLLRK